MLVLGVSVAARADVYSWTDAEGVVHFTNLKPSGGKWNQTASLFAERRGAEIPRECGASG